MDSRDARAASVDCGEIYDAAKARFVALIRGLDADGLTTLVPATPDWCVRDALAHVVGIAADLNTGDLSSVDPDTWTATQVASRRDRTIAEVVAEWDHEAPTFEDGLRLFGYELGSHFVGDLHAHLQDVRAALGLDPDCDEVTVRVALDFYLDSWSEDLIAAGIGAVRVVADGEERVVGTGGVVASVTAPAFELLRALSGRRSAAQIGAFAWTGDAARVIPTMSRYDVPGEDLAD